jgi:DNA (cytosine-5)-methyltransferase 1
VTITTIARDSGTESTGRQLTVAEFFAGVGLARMGLEAASFEVVWSNDFDRDKVSMYKGHFRRPDDHEPDDRSIVEVHASDLPDDLSLAWASFPCIDLSLAGWRRGMAKLSDTHSSTFWEFTRVMNEMEDARPRVVALENVVGLATSHGGEDLRAAIAELNSLGYSVDVLTLDARRFVPQSRPRLFLVGAMEPPKEDLAEESVLRPDWLQKPFNDPDLRTHRALLPPPPPMLKGGLSRLVEDMGPSDSRWWDEVRTKAFMAELSPVNLARIEDLRLSSQATYRTAYRRTRQGKPSWEIRPDDIAGCLRTARGGSSKQAVVQAKDGVIRVRWMTPREYARLMGADEFKLEGLRNIQALCGFGDAVCVPVVKWLAENYLLPLVSANVFRIENAAATM